MRVYHRRRKITSQKLVVYGFTLIELLVVVAIISLLVAILLPSLSRARNLAKGTVCLSNMRQLSYATVMYRDENQAYPPFRWPSGGTPNEFGRNRPRWHWAFSDLLAPPIDERSMAADPGTLTLTSKYYNDPGLTGEFATDIRNGAYGYNYQYLGNSRTNGGDFINFPVGTGNIKTEALTIVFGDSRGAGVPHGKHSYTLDPPKMRGGSDAFGPKASDISGTGTAHSPIEARHNGRGNAGFLDGHAESQPLEKYGYVVGENAIVVPSDPDGTNRLFTGDGDDDPAF